MPGRKKQRSRYQGSVGRGKIELWRKFAIGKEKREGKETTLGKSGKSGSLP